MPMLDTPAKDFELNAPLLLDASGTPVQQLLEESTTKLVNGILTCSGEPRSKAQRLWQIGRVVPAALNCRSQAAAAGVTHALHGMAARIIAANNLDEVSREQHYARAAAFAESFALRPWTSTDKTRYSELLNDRLMWEQLPERFPEPFTEELAEQLIEFVNGQDNQYVRAMTRAGTPVGQLRLEFPATDDRRSAEISYWIGRNYWGQGLASKLVGYGVLHLFQAFPELDYVFAKVMVSNPASAALLRKASFREEGLVQDTTGNWAGHRAQRFGVFRVTCEPMFSATQSIQSSQRSA